MANDAERPLIALSGVGRRFGIDPPIDAVRDVDLRVAEGEWLAIAGPSGSGKSTLLNVIGCLDRPTAGVYDFDGIDLAALSDGQRAGLRSRAIGFVFQSFHLLAHRTVLENVMIAEIYGGSSSRGRRDRATEALLKVGLGHRRDFLPTRISGGERQRAAIARALVVRPRVLLCDEPTGNLDSVTGATILDLFADLHAEGLTMLVITHDADVAARATRQVQMIDGMLSEAV